MGIIQVVVGYPEEKSQLKKMFECNSEDWAVIS